MESKRHIEDEAHAEGKEEGITRGEIGADFISGLYRNRVKKGGRPHDIASESSEEAQRSLMPVVHRSGSELNPEDFLGG